jgi:hypothetical protein
LDALVPKIIRGILPAVTNTLKEIYKGDKSASFVNAAGILSTNHKVPLPAATRFMSMVNDAFEGLMTLLFS